MERHDKLQFAVYYNVPNPHVMIHNIKCKEVNKNGGEHAYLQGGWGYFTKEYEAKSFAKAISQFLELPDERTCQKCFKYIIN